MKIASLLIVTVLMEAAAYAQAPAPAASHVRRALTTLNRVVDHTQRLIDAKNYTRLPGENEEFREGIAALQTGIGSEHPDLKMTAEPLIREAVAASQSLADTSATDDAAQIAKQHTNLAESVQHLLAAFPVDDQPTSANRAREHAEDAKPQPK